MAPAPARGASCCRRNSSCGVRAAAGDQIRQRRVRARAGLGTDASIARRRRRGAGTRRGAAGRGTDGAAAGRHRHGARADARARRGGSVREGRAGHRHGVAVAPQRGRSARLLLRGRLLVARPGQSGRALHPERRPQQSQQLQRSSARPDAAVRGDARARRGLHDHEGPQVLDRGDAARTRLVHRALHDDEPEPPLRAGDPGARHRPRHRDHRHDPSRRGRARPRAPRRRERLVPRRRGGNAAVVRRLPRLADDGSIWQGRARRDQQPRDLLGDAGGGVRALHRQPDADGRLPHALQDRPAAADGARWQLPPRTGADEAVRLFALQSRGDGHDLPDPLDAGRRSVGVRAARRARHAQGDGLHGAIHQGQEVVAETARRHVRRQLADAAGEPALRGNRAQASGVHRSLVHAAARLGRRGGHPELLHPPAGPVVRVRRLTGIAAITIRCAAISGCVRLAGVVGVAGLVTLSAQVGRPRAETLKSPDGHVALDLQITDAGTVRYRVSHDGVAALDWSTAGITIDGVNITDDAMVAEIGARTSTNRDYPTRGVHSTAHDKSNNVTVYLQDAKTHARYTLEARAFDDGVGLRFVLPPSPVGFGGRVPSATRTPDEATTFKIPAGSMTWTHDLHMHYEAVNVKRPIEDVPAGDWAAPPLTYKLPGTGGYASITEAALTNYAGMALQADGAGGYAARLGHAHPVSYPYALRYTPEDVQRLSRPASIAGAIRTPWRVILVSKDLNGLVNNDVIHNLAPPPDPALFPQGQATPWSKPGRAVWRYLDGGDNTYDGLKEFTDLAAKLGFEHHVVEGVWRQWTPAQLKAFVDYATERHVGIWLWKHSRDLQTAQARREFFDLCRANGVVGAKIDFFDHEAKETIDLYDAILREAAEHQIMVDFHGANKPTGLDRTWPNELTREAIYGFEHRGNALWGPHDATVPFTRFLAGSAEFQ